MIPVPKKTYSRKANQTSSSESSFNYTKYTNDENEKENKGNEARQCKNKAIKKIRQDVLEDSFETNIEGPANKTEKLFEELLSSPPKVEVKYKPLSFWAKKVQEIEAENPVKKKCQLYELSDSDESCSPELRKKKVKRKPGVRKKKAKNTVFSYDCNKLYKKKPNERDVNAKPNKVQEGIIIKERLLLKKEKEKLADKENKFTFNKNSSLIGITSTPGKDKFNIIGASNFSFFSPIQNSDATPIIKPPNFDISSIRNEDEDKTEEENTVVHTTPVIRKSTRLRTKRVSEDDYSNFSNTLKNGTVENFSNPFAGFNSGDLKSSVKLDSTSACSSRCEDREHKASFENFSNPFPGFNSGDLKSSVKLNSSARSSRCEDNINKASLHQNSFNFKNNENEVLVSKNLSSSEHSLVDSENNLSFKSAKSHCSVNESELEILKRVEIGRKVMLLLQLNFVMKSEHLTSFLTSCKKRNMGVMRMWKSVEYVCENEHPCHYSDNEDNDGEFVFCTQNVFQNSNDDFSQCESVNAINDQIIENSYCDAEGEIKEECYDTSINQSFEHNVTVRTNRGNFSRIHSTGGKSYNSKSESSNEISSENVSQNSSESKSANTIIEQNSSDIREKLKQECNDTSMNQSFERNLCNVTTRRNYGNFSRIHSNKDKSYNSQSESSNEISVCVPRNEMLESSTRLIINNDARVSNDSITKVAEEEVMLCSELESTKYTTALEIENLQETLEQLSVNPSKDDPQESSQYLSKLSLRQSINKKFNKIGNDSSIIESSPELSNKTVMNANSFKKELYETAANISQEKLKVPNEEAAKYLSPVLDSSIYHQNKLIMTPTSSKSLIIDDTISSPLPIFESTVCEPGNQMLESTARLSSFNNYRKSRKPFKRDVRASDWNITKISEEDVMPSPVLESTAVPDNFSVSLKPGKKWVRSMSVLRQIQNGSILDGNEGDGSSVKGRNYKSFVQEVLEMQPAAFHESVVDADLSKTISGLTMQMSNMSMSKARRSLKVVPINNTTVARDSMFKTALGLVEEEEEEDETDCQSKDDTIVENVTLKDLKKSITARDVVLARCNQEEPVPFEENFNERRLKNCKKIGEGVYGEVFMYNSDTVIKIIPIEGSEMVNGDRQKKFDEILSEIVIAMELSNLRHGQQNRTSGFNELKRCWCVVGEYPQYLIDLWEEFDRTGNGSENDHPSMFKSDQLYIVLELANGGKDLEAFVFNSAEQSISVFVQTAYILAVAEKALEFEHRDLHWGNLLISSTKEKTASFLLEGVEYNVPLKGVKVSIIDFTLSRMTYEGCCIFNDLSVDPELFTAKGDYQFEIYRLMQNEVKNDWSLHKAKTNVYWLHYILDKMISMVRYKNKSSKIHKTNIQKIKDFKNIMLNFVSSSEFVLNEVP